MDYVHILSCDFLSIIDSDQLFFFLEDVHLHIFQFFKVLNPFLGQIRRNIINPIKIQASLVIDTVLTRFKCHNVWLNLLFECGFRLVDDGLGIFLDLTLSYPFGNAMETGLIRISSREQKLVYLLLFLIIFSSHSHYIQLLLSLKACIPYFSTQWALIEKASASFNPESG